MLTVTASRLPFPSRSPSAKNQGRAPVGKSLLKTEKVPSPLPWRIEITFALGLLVTRSSLPSASMSARAHVETEVP